jgi:hypothetical protein
MSELANIESTMSNLILKGDIGKLSEAEKVAYYKALCERVEVDWTTKPFDYIVLNGKQCLYLTKAGAEQLNRVHNVSISINGTEMIGEIYVVTARAVVNGRHNDSTGAVSIKGLGGDALANAYMKAETKAKRRATIGLLGLGMLDESEASSITSAPVTYHPIMPIPASKEDLDNLTIKAKGKGWTGDMLSAFCKANYGDDFRKRFTKDMINEVLEAIDKANDIRDKAELEAIKEELEEVPF